MKTNNLINIKNNKRTKRPDSIYLWCSSSNYKWISCENLLKNFHLTKNQIEEIIQKNTSKQIKTIVNYIDELYKELEKSGINIQPDISTYIYKVFTDEVEE
jgi:hypothetical protein